MEIVDLESSVSINASKIVDLESSVSVNASEIVDLESSVSVNASEIVDLESSVSVNASEIVNLENSILNPTFQDVYMDGVLYKQNLVDNRYEVLLTSGTSFTFSGQTYLVNVVLKGGGGGGGNGKNSNSGSYSVGGGGGGSGYIVSGEQFYIKGDKQLPIQSVQVVLQVKMVVQHLLLAHFHLVKL